MISIERQPRRLKWLLTDPAQYRQSLAYNLTLAALKQIQANGPERKTFGICGNVETLYRYNPNFLEGMDHQRDTNTLLYSLFYSFLVSVDKHDPATLLDDTDDEDDWIFYPVEGCPGAHSHAQDAGTLWDEHSHSGQRRLRLLDYIITTLEAAP